MSSIWKRKSNSAEISDHHPSVPQGMVPPTLANQAQRRSADVRSSTSQGEQQQIQDSISGLFARMNEKEQEVKMYQKRLEDAQDENNHIRREKDLTIQQLKDTLAEVRSKLKVVSESQLRSQERNQAMDDSSVERLFNQISQTIKDIVQTLLRKANAGAVQKLLFENSNFRDALAIMLGGKITTTEILFLLETAQKPLTVLRFLLRAVMFTMIQTAFYNNNMFFGTHHGLREVYQNLLELPPENSDNQSLLSNAKKDASVWRSQTMAIIDKNADRLGVSAKRQEEMQKLETAISRLLAPIEALNTDLDSKVGDGAVAALVENAASLSIILGKQRAQFEVQISNLLEMGLQPDIMYAEWFNANQGEDEEIMSTTMPHVVVTVVAPALVKFGNAEGERYESGKIQCRAIVLMVDAQLWNEIKRAAASKDGIVPSTIVASSAEKAKAITASLLQGTAASTDGRRRSSEYPPGSHEGDEPSQGKLQRAHTHAVSPIDGTESSSVGSSVSKLSSPGAPDSPDAAAEKSISHPQDEQKVLLAESKAHLQVKNGKNPTSPTKSNEQKPSGVKRSCPDP